MDAFTTELLDRSPLACAALELLDFALDRDQLEQLFEQHRGRCYEDVLGFPDLVTLVHTALLQHEGSGHRMFLELEADGLEPVDESNFYRKLGRTPQALSQALLSSSAARLASVIPEGVSAELPRCFDGFTVLAGDGKKVKQVAKRLLPTRGVSGSLLGAKALVAADLRTGLALAMSTDLDGQANDVPMVPALIEQLHQVVDGPMLSVWDRQFSDTATMRRVANRPGEPGDRFVVRVRKGLAFEGESCVTHTREDGHTVTDEVGTLCKGAKALRVRRVTLERGEEPAVQIVTDLLEASQYPADDLLALYRRRWGIEQVFQEITETFGLSKLIGCSPKAVLLQLAVCLTLYNLLQVIRGHVADDAKLLTAAVSMHYLFDHTRRQLVAWAYHGKGQRPQTTYASSAMTDRLSGLLTGAFDTRIYAKRPDPGPRPKPPPQKPIRGGHSSTQRLIQAARHPANA